MEKIDINFNDPGVFQKLVLQIVASNLTPLFYQLTESGIAEEAALYMVMKNYSKVWSKLSSIYGELPWKP